MEDEADEVVTEAMNVNFVDHSQYPSSKELEQRCLAMLADLWHAPVAEGGRPPPGTSTIGSSEAAMLAGLPLKRRWQAARRAAGKPTHKPNLVIGAEAQVCWEKFCSYFEVECKRVHVTVDTPIMTPNQAFLAVDENTIGVVAILGSHYTGQYEDVKEINYLLELLKMRKGYDVWIHVDAASGGFVAPFVQPNLVWDFRLSRVASINASGHKYGLVYPGLGWVAWRSEEHVPESMVFKVKYLGGEQMSLNLNFSRSAANIIGQYYQFLRLGREGYTYVIMNLMKVAQHLANLLYDTGHFVQVGRSMDLPVVAFRLKSRRDSAGNEEPRVYDEFDIADRLQEYRWMVPAYPLPPNAGDVKMMRIVVREEFTMPLAERLVQDMQRVVEWLDHHYVYDEAKMKQLHRRFQVHHPLRHEGEAADAEMRRAGVC